MDGGSSGGSTSGGSTSGGSGSTVEMAERENHHNRMNIEVGVEGCDDSELELGLGLSLAVVGSKNIKPIPRILTAKDLPSLGCRPPLSSTSSCSSLGLRTPASANNSSSNNFVSGNNVSVGTKRAASPNAASQVVGWPPIRAYRMNSMANQAKSIANGEENAEFEESKGKDVIYTTDEKGNAESDRVPGKNSVFVKVNMDGVAIGRKVDLNAHPSYESLAQTLEEMFTNKVAEKSNGSELALMPKRPSKLLDGSSDYVLIYEDKDGDWMLVGDVPWGMFLSSVKRLRIMRTSEDNGLAPRSDERMKKPSRRPI